LLEQVEATLVQNYIADIAECYLMDTELRQLHRRFGHPLVQQLMRVLQRSRHEVSQQAIEHLTKYYDVCQKHNKSLDKFKFMLQDDYKFNYLVYIDIIYIDG